VFVGFECGSTWKEGKPGRIAYIKIANVPKVGMDPIHAVAVTLKYFDEETGEEAYEKVIGRWSHLARVADPVEASAHRRVAVEGDGNPYRIEVAMIISGYSEMFVIDDRQMHKGMERSLGVGPTILEVRLQGRTTGRHVDATHRYRLIGKAHDIQIEPI